MSGSDSHITEDGYLPINILSISHCLEQEKWHFLHLSSRLFQSYIEASLGFFFFFFHKTFFCFFVSSKEFW